jgi:hypothetical protein
MNLIYTKVAELCFDKQNAILYITILEHSEMSLKNTINHYDIIEQVTKNTKHVAIIDASNYYITSPEAMAYSAEKSTFKNRVGVIYYNVAMSNKLTLDFFKKQYKPDMFIITVKTKEEALIYWLPLKDRYLK